MRLPAAIAALLAAIALALPGCYWARYPELMETHLGLLLEFAAKLEGLASDGERVPAQDWGEFTYPLERARDFARIAAQRYPGRASLAAFDRVLERYAALVASPDVLERPDAGADVAAQVAQLREEAARTRAALAAEAS